MRRTAQSSRLRPATPKRMQFATVNAAEITLALQKALANRANPAAYPLPSEPACFENICNGFVSSIKRTQWLERMVGGAVAALAQDAHSRRAKLGDVALLDVRSPVPVEVQAAGIPSLRTKFERSDVTATARHDVQRPAGPLPSGRTLGACGLRLSRFEVRDTTEWFGDEPYIGGTTIDDNGTVAAVPEFKVGDLDQGDVWQPPEPRVLNSFQIGNPGRWPRLFQFALTIREEDSGDQSAFVFELTRRIRDKLQQEIQEYLDGGVDPLLAWILGEITSWILDWVFGQLRGWLGDELFPPALHTLELPGRQFSFDGSLISGPYGWITTGYSAEYWYDTEWELVTVAGATR